MIILDERQVKERLSMPECIALMRQALIKLETGGAVQPLRSIMVLPGDDLFGFMPAWMDDCFGAKIVTGFHGNAGTGYPSHMGYVMVFDSAHGAPLGMADAGAVTELRTGAVSAIATDLLARKDAKTLAIIGCGVQGRSHLNAILCVRDIEQVSCYDINADAARAFSHGQSAEYGVNISVAPSVRDAVRNADIVCTVTPSKQAFLEAEWIVPGTHINAVGAFTPKTRELSSALVRKSRLYADQVEAMERECGEYLIPLREGVITREHIVGSLGAVLLQRAPGRRTDGEITVFSALGLAVEDVMCAKALVCAAKKGAKNT
ncbi:MAG: ornithine cyclodeaminase family protein [Clostridiales bacterium]|nr:ornithine cyclodeaminase family protein [Clostridiales bacterium]